MGNNISTTSNDQAKETKRLSIQKPFHSVHDINALITSDDDTKQNEQKDRENTDVNEKEIRETKSDALEISFSGLSPQITKKQKAKRKWEQSLKKAIKATTKSNIIGHIAEVFKYHKRLAKGSSCCVLLCQHKTNKKLYALKEMNKFSQWNPMLYITERDILLTLKSHINIMTYFDSYIDEKCLYIASEYCGGGTLLDKIINMKIFTENIAAKYITTILNVIDFIHTKNIAHRDLKPNNIVFDKPGDDGVLKLIDFGDAIIIEDDETDKTFVGTLHYFTPEMIRNSNRNGWEIRKADTYCIGVMAYVLLTGWYPFHSKNRKEIKQQILKGEILWPNHVKLTDECKNFVLCLLNQNVKQRLNAKQALSHKWLTGYASNDDLGDNLKKYQKEFHHSNMLQRLLIDAIFSEMNTKEKTFCIQELKKYKNKRETKDKNETTNVHVLVSPNTKARRNSLIYEQEFVEFMIANHVDENKAKTTTHNLFKQVSMRQNIIQQNSSVRTQTLDAFDIETLLEQLIDDNAFEMTDEFGFEMTPEPLIIKDEPSDDILLSLNAKNNIDKNKNIKFNPKHSKISSIVKIKSMNYIDEEKSPKMRQHVMKRSQSMHVEYKPSIKITNSNLKLSIEISRTLTNKSSNQSLKPDRLDSELIMLDNDDYDDAIAFGRSESVYKTSVDLSKKASLCITVEQFRSLLSKAPKKLDIESVILDLDPNNTGVIDLRNITNYSREIEMED